MSFNPQLPPGKQIRNLLFVLFSGIFGAILLTLLLLYYYGPQGHYLIKNALLSPEVIAQMSLDEKNPKKDLTLFDKIEFSYQDVETKKTVHLPVNKKNYAKFYEVVANDKSLSEAPAAIAAEFTQMPSTSLTLLIQNQDLKKDISKNQLFQEVQFLYKGNYYRLQLRDTNGTNWIYFYHPHIYEDAFTLFTSLNP